MKVHKNRVRKKLIDSAIFSLCTSERVDCKLPVGILAYVIRFEVYGYFVSPKEQENLRVPLYTLFTVNSGRIPSY